MFSRDPNPTSHSELAVTLTDSAVLHLPSKENFATIIAIGQIYLYKRTGEKVCTVRESKVQLEEFISWHGAPICVQLTETELLYL